MCFLAHCYTIEQVELFLLFVEENALRLADRRQMADLIPFVFSQEQESIKKKFLASYIRRDNKAWGGYGYSGAVHR